jgi:hypothetical protein
MKPTNVHTFYSLGVALERLYANVGVDRTGIDVFSYLIDPHNSLMEFLAGTENMPIQDTRSAANYLFQFTGALYKSFGSNPDEAQRKLNQSEVSMFIHGKDEFEKAFEREYRNLDVLTVMKKGIYDTRLLMRGPEEELPERLRKFLPQQALDDWKEAGRCLAFEVPTACAFHICRGTEALMLGYYKALARKPWPFNKRDWNIYIAQLGVEGAPKSITTRLDEIRDMDRNAYTHPEKTVSLDEAPVLFRLCTGVTFYMCQELEKLTP